MKNNMFVFSIIMLVGIVSICLLFNGCTSEKPKVDSSTTFYEVTSKLDQGGNFYLYLSTQKVMNTIQKYIAKIRHMIDGELIEDPDLKGNILKIYDFVSHLFQNCGLVEISGVGMSSIALENKLYHTKLVIHHHKGKGKGLMWKLLRDKPHQLTELKLLPVNTVMAMFFEFNFASL